MAIAAPDDAPPTIPTLGERVGRMPGPDYVAGMLRNMGGMVVFGLEAMLSMFTRRPIWGREFLIQCNFITRSTVVPVMLVNAVLGLAIIGLCAGIPLSALGTLVCHAEVQPPGLV